MPASRRTPRPRRQPPELPAVPGGLLDWRSNEHWSETRAQCRYCPELTNLRDVYQRPAHKVCAEEAARAWVEQQNTHYEHGRNEQL
ncbi:hypothetical protein [Streptomyces sp. MNU103]|uniref:hypothetical protein n=1 Tax=Streptomyces sp. MNU103 TaxID=2560024 RepID=UPI001E3C4804|nr:hypothetical protein [Streptomyces sp. MNU103]